jgi:hypothetical protein
LAYNMQQEDRLHARAEAIRADAERWLTYLWRMEDEYEDFLQQMKDEEAEYYEEMQREEFYATGRILGRSINRPTSRLHAGYGIGKPRLDS